MKKLPTSIEIYGLKYSIKYKWNLTDDNGDPCYGLTDTHKKVIWLDRLISGEEKEDTFLHEQLHVLFKEIEVSGTLLNYDTEEMLIRNIVKYIRSKYTMRLKK